MTEAGRDFVSSDCYLPFADDRTDIHNGHSSQRILSRNHDKVGLSGEFAFGEFSGIFPNTSLLLGGDGGVDFTVRLDFTVDVKTFRKPINLIHEQGAPLVDIYVLAGFDEESGKSVLIGWEWGLVLGKAPVRDFGHGVKNHYIHSDNLRNMEELKSRLGR